MKLYLILYLGTSIVGVAGPLPYSMKECQTRAALLQAGADTIARTGRATNGTHAVVPADEVAKFRQMRFQCEMRSIKPVVLGDAT